MGVCQVWIDHSTPEASRCTVYPAIRFPIRYHRRLKASECFASYQMWARVVLSKLVKVVEVDFLPFQSLKKMLFFTDTVLNSHLLSHSTHTASIGSEGDADWGRHSPSVLEATRWVQCTSDSLHHPLCFPQGLGGWWMAGAPKRRWGARERKRDRERERAVAGQRGLQGARTDPWHLPPLHTTKPIGNQ